nr:MAG TPA: hypothetical protein [Microviridae sp.]
MNLKLLRNFVVSVIFLLTTLFVAVNMPLIVLSPVTLGLFVLIMSILLYHLRFIL